MAIWQRCFNLAQKTNQSLMTPKIWHHTNNAIYYIKIGIPSGILKFQMYFLSNKNLVVSDEKMTYLLHKPLIANLVSALTVSLTLFNVDF